MVVIDWKLNDQGGILLRQYKPNYDADKHDYFTERIDH